MCDLPGRQEASVFIVIWQTRHPFAEQFFGFDSAKLLYMGVQGGDSVIGGAGNRCVTPIQAQRLRELIISTFTVFAKRRASVEGGYPNKTFAVTS